MYTNEESIEHHHFTANDLSEGSQDSVLSGLKFIGKIRKNEKINTKTLTLQDNSSWLTGFFRLLTVQNRAKTMLYIRDIIDKSFNIVDIYSSSSDVRKQRMGSYIKKDIDGCIPGLKNLQDTYSDDVMFTCRLESCILDIKLRLLSYEDQNIPTDVE